MQVLGDGGGAASEQAFQLVLSGDREAARARLRDMDGILGETWTCGGLRFAVCDRACHGGSRGGGAAGPAFAINRIPRRPEAGNRITDVRQAFPSLDQDQRDRLVAHVESLIAGRTRRHGRIHYYTTRG